jgi:hypothetical protein
MGAKIGTVVASTARALKLSGILQSRAAGTVVLRRFINHLMQSH